MKISLPWKCFGDFSPEDVEDGEASVVGVGVRSQKLPQGKLLQLGRRLVQQSQNSG